MRMKAIYLVLSLILSLYITAIAEFLLGANDVIVIDVMPNYYYGTSDTLLYGGEQMVDPDGNIHLKLVGDVNVSGMTPAMLSSVLEEEYADYLVNPEVVIKVINVSNSRFIISGEIWNPGVYTLNKDISVVEAIQLAGGPTDEALLYDVKVLRGGLEQPEVLSCNVDEILKKGKFDTNVNLESGDIIYVPKTLISRYNDLLERVTPTINAIVGGGRVVDTFED